MVVEWMAAANMYNYADVFKSKDVKGSDLLQLDYEKLLVSAVRAGAWIWITVYLRRYKNCFFSILLFSSKIS